jgi:hypothetical protein
MSSRAYCLIIKLVYILILNATLALSGGFASLDILELANIIRVLQVQSHKMS